MGGGHKSCWADANHFQNNFYTIKITPSRKEFCPTLKKVVKQKSWHGGVILTSHFNNRGRAVGN